MFFREAMAGTSKTLGPESPFHLNDAWGTLVKRCPGTRTHLWFLLGELTGRHYVGLFLGNQILHSLPP